MQGIGKRFVYILRSESDPTCHYVGLTGDVENRLYWHNFGPDGQTLRHRPWKLIASIEFANEPTALRFERYLTSGSGRAFAKRHFDPTPTYAGRGSDRGRMATDAPEASK